MGQRRDQNLCLIGRPASQKRESPSAVRRGRPIIFDMAVKSTSGARSWLHIL